MFLFMLTNARCALRIYKMQGFSAWCGYQCHRGECDQYRLNGRTAPNTFNRQAPDVCLRHKGGNACYPKRGCSR